MKKKQREKLNILFKPLFFAVSAFIALISVTVAWFAANANVGSSGMQVRLAGAKYELASEGVPGLYYIPGDTGESVTIDGKTLYKTSDANTAITWMVGADSNLNNAAGGPGTLQPGAKGKITFYILPREDNDEEFTVEISLSRLLYSRSEEATDLEIMVSGTQESTTAYLEELPEETEQEVKQLLEGHLLFFTSYEEPYYSGWIASDTLEVAVSGTKPVPVTIYWVWPYVLDWLVDTGTTATLCDSSLQGGDYQMILQDIQENPSRYLRKSSLETKQENVFDPDNITEEFETYSWKYNRGDEFIGTHVQYLFIEIQAQ